MSSVLDFLTSIPDFLSGSFLGSLSLFLPGWVTGLVVLFFGVVVVVAAMRVIAMILDSLPLV